MAAKTPADFALADRCVELVLRGGNATQDALVKDLCAAAHRYHTAADVNAKLLARAELIYQAVKLSQALK